MRSAATPSIKPNAWLRSDGQYPGGWLPLNTVAWFVLCGMCFMTAIICFIPAGGAWQLWSLKGILFAGLACISFSCGSASWPGEFSRRQYLPPTIVKERGEAVDWWSVNSTLNVALLLVLCGALLVAALLTGHGWMGAGAMPAAGSIILYSGALLSGILAEGIWQIVQVVELAELAILKGPSLDDELADTTLWYSFYDERAARGNASPVTANAFSAASLGGSISSRN